MTDGASGPSRSGTEAVSGVLRRRREQIAQRWADLPLFQAGRLRVVR
ncbi:hypothetical protein [Nocardiopsis halotolerans]|nr:hypothetical protein [Nocardiopsis halotolerans]